MVIDTSKVKTKVDSVGKMVVICDDRDKRSFHSHENCIGLDNCETTYTDVTVDEAKNKLKRKACCICWESPGKDCVNDNPDYYADENYEVYDDGVYLDDFWWLSDGGGYFAVIALVGSVAILSNEFYAGTSYAFLPPEFVTQQGGDLTNRFGVDLFLRKNFKRNALEYGYSYFNFDITDDRISPSRFETIEAHAVSVKYLHNMNQYFTSQNNPPVEFNLAMGPLVNYGWSRDNGFNEKFGVGASIAFSIPLSNRFNIDLRSDISSLSTNFNIGFRWVYQKRLRWNRNRD
jgi:hypothetical protein